MPLNDLIPPSTEDYLKQFQASTPDSWQAFENAKATRQASDAGKTNPERDLNLRDAEHALFAQTMVDRSPVMGRLGLLAGAPAYSAAKYVAQNGPGTAPLVQKLTGLDLRGSTPPSLSELYWGLRPVFSSVRPKASSPPSGRGPDPEQP